MLEDWNKGEKRRVFGDDEGWRNESLASSCIVKCRKMSSTTFFTKGILNEIGYSIREKPDLNVVYVNATLTSMQLKKLEKRWNDIINENDDRLRQYFLKAANKQGENTPTEMETDTEMSTLEIQQSQRELGGEARKIRVVDRFAIILQIFAARAKHRTA